MKAFNGFSISSSLFPTQERFLEKKQPPWVGDSEWYMLKMMAQEKRMAPDLHGIVELPYQALTSYL